MKLATTFLLVLFIAFLSTPTIVSLIEKKSDTSCFYNTSEEELIHKHIKVELKFEPTLALLCFSNTSSTLILSENLSKHDNVATAIVIPPPKQV